MNFFKKRFTSKPRRIAAAALFCVVYILFLWFTFMSKGIYIDGHFYKKSSNLTTITYTCTSSKADFDTIVLKKHKDRSEITVDGVYKIIIDQSGTATAANDASAAVLDAADWASVASQKAEGIRGFGRKPWKIVLAVYALILLAKVFSTKLYSIFKPGHAASENYYKTVDMIFYISTLLVPVFISIPV